MNAIESRSMIESGTSPIEMLAASKSDIDARYAAGLIKSDNENDVAAGKALFDGKIQSIKKETALKSRLK